jgi:chitinase
MSLSTIFSAAAVGILASTASAASFNPASTKNVAVYWGQGNAQGPLSDVCADPNVDIVNIGFITQFPKALGEYPVTNFGKCILSTHVLY